MLNSEGRVYTTGSNSMGQLGHSQGIATPVGLESKRIAWVGGGEYFSLAIDTQGNGYGWGAGYVRALAARCAYQAPTCSTRQCVTDVLVQTRS